MSDNDVGNCRICGLPMRSEYEPVRASMARLGRHAGWGSNGCIGKLKKAVAELTTERDEALQKVVELEAAVKYALADVEIVAVGYASGYWALSMTARDKLEKALEHNTEPAP